MAHVRDLNASIRENIMAHLKDRFETVEEGVGGSTLTWEHVTRDPLSKKAFQFESAVSILDPTERKTKEINYELATLRVAVEFTYRVMVGDERGTEANRLLMEIQKTMRSDIQTGGLALNTVEVRSELDIDGPDDKLIGGVSFWDVTYRHRNNDPTKLVGE